MISVKPAPENNAMIAKPAPALTPSLGRDLLQSLTVAVAAGLGTALVAGMIVMLLALAGG
jgi:hypothetical protein